MLQKKLKRHETTQNKIEIETEKGKVFRSVMAIRIYWNNVEEVMVRTTYMHATLFTPACHQIQFN